MIRCKKCGKVACFNYHFGAYMCKCGWMDDSYNTDRIEKKANLFKGRLCVNTASLRQS